MFYVYDFDGYYVGKTDRFFWAKKMADYYDGFVKESDCFDEEWLVYDSMGDILEMFWL